MPSLLIDIAANVAQLQKDMASAQKSVEGFARSAQTAFKSLSGVLGAAGIGMGVREVIGAYADAEKAAMRMGMALRNQGEYSREALNDMQEYASALQYTTGFEDDLTLSIMGNLKSYGMSNDEVKRATKVALDFAAAKENEGMSVSTAAELLGKAYKGNTSTLSRYGVVLEETTDSTGKFEAAMRQLEERFGGSAQAQLETYAGQWQRIKSIFGDVAEFVGHIFLKSFEVVMVAFGELSVRFYAFLESIPLIGDAYKDIANNARALQEENIKALQSFDHVSDALDKMSTVQKAATEETKLTGEALKETTKAFDDYAKVIATIGEERLKFAESDFTENLKNESATIEELRAGLEAYLEVVNAVYEARIEGEKQLAEAMSNAGLDPEKYMEAQKEILEMEKKNIEERLDAWKSYYGELESRHTEAVEAMKAATDKLQEAEKSLQESRTKHVSTLTDLYVKLAEIQGKASTDEYIRQLKLQEIEQLRIEADRASGEERIKILESIKGKWAELTGEVTASYNGFNAETMKWEKGTYTVKSAYESTKEAIENVEAVEKQITAEKEKIIKAAKDEVRGAQEFEQATKKAMETAKSEIDGYKQKILTISDTIRNMDKTIALQVDTKQAMSALSSLKSLYDSIQSKTVTITMQYQGEGGGGGGYTSSGSESRMSGGEGITSSAFGNLFDVGGVIPFAMGGIVDRPHFFKFQGGQKTGVMGEAGPEAIVPLARGKDGRLGIRTAETGGKTVTFNWTGNIIAGDKSPEQLARTLVKPLRAELRRMAVMN